MRFRKTLFLLALLIVARPVAAQEFKLTGFDDYVRQALKDWEVPGLAIAIVRNDVVVLAKGYGVRKFGEPAPVDEHTVFAVGSVSKAFTAAAVAALVDDGKVKWDDPVTKHLPGFELFDPYVTRELTITDLLTHRAGLDRADMLWYGTSYDRDEIVRRVRLQKPSWSFRSRFGYNNNMFLTAGQLVARVSGRSWDEFIAERFFKPLGMTSTNSSVTALKSNLNLATPHSRLPGLPSLENRVQPIAWRLMDNIGPAGSINSNVTDMAQWVRLQLSAGQYGGRQILSPAVLKEMHTPQMLIRPEPPWSTLFPAAHFITYGMGWFLHDYQGRKVVDHTGNIDGMTALVALLPEEKIGFVILSNMNSTNLPKALEFKLLDLILQAPTKDWSWEMLKETKAREAQALAAEQKQLQERITGTHPTLALENYAGAYADDLYGEARISFTDGKLTMSIAGSALSDLEHWQYDAFRATPRDRPTRKSLVSFALNSQGKVEELKLNVTGSAAVVFRRVAAKTK
ncbi:MAG TPA: serine hydrolase [Blastocatellia bacterium]|nr:serine hydrolase [Blastocatellia bacterium]HMX27615.1 serine hydrolase [Blastocatellia bacterium]HMY71084.1 serine hydrolase [Blastocatellia bacterium]HMZ17797.1 serine hydrolase [Blastocatellia bacterium]HNG29498.1 serine hydrolase [Blastocatellia bacterium]